MSDKYHEIKEAKTMIRVSAKVLGETVLDDFCPRCYWFKLQFKIPWQIFPGIFNSIDAYTKKCVHALIDDINAKKVGIPEWFKEIGSPIGYRKVPHWSKFKTDFPDFGITLSGVCDDILVDRSSRFIIPDYKTAKFTKNQDKLLPMYRMQLNGYWVIAEACNITPVTDIFLIYFQPVTDEMAAKANLTPEGFKMPFDGYPIRIEYDSGSVIEALRKTQKIYESEVPPEGREGCDDCGKLDKIVAVCN